MSDFLTPSVFRGSRAPFSLMDDDFFQGFFRAVPRSRDGQVSAASEHPPAIDVTETEDGYVLHADLPGVRKEDIQLSVDGGVLSLSCDSSREEGGVDGKPLIRERRSITFQRALTLGDNVDQEKIAANYDDGVLEVRIPKKEPAGSPTQRIEIS